MTGFGGLGAELGVGPATEPERTISRFGLGLPKLRPAAKYRESQALTGGRGIADGHARVFTGGKYGLEADTQYFWVVPLCAV